MRECEIDGNSNAFRVLNLKGKDAQHLLGSLTPIETCSFCCVVLKLDKKRVKR